MNSDPEQPINGGSDDKADRSSFTQPSHIKETSASNAGVAVGGDNFGDIQTTYVQVDANDVLNADSINRKIKKIIIGVFVLGVIVFISSAYLGPLIRGSDLEAIVDVYDEGYNNSELITPPDIRFSLEITNKGEKTVVIKGIPEFVINIKQDGILKSYPLSAPVNGCGSRFFIGGSCEESIELEPLHNIKVYFCVDYLGKDIILGNLPDIRLSPDDVSFHIEGESTLGNYSTDKRGLRIENPYYWELSRYESDILKYKDDLLLDPNSSKTYRDIGWAYYMVDRYNDSIAAYDKAIDLEKATPDYQEHDLFFNINIEEYLYLKGIALKDIGYNQEALKLFDDVIKQAETYIGFFTPPGFESGWLPAQAYYNKGVVLSRMGMYSEAIDAYNVVENRGNSNSDVGSLVHKKKAESLLELGPGRNIEANRELAEFDEYKNIPYRWLN